MSKFRYILGLSIALLAGGFVLAETDALKELNCFVSGRDINKEVHSEWKEGQVYFCCEKCQAAFDKDKEKFTAKANMQLAASGQYEQKACPITGNKLNPETAIEAGQAKIAFCCNNCKGKAEKMDEADRVQELFSDKSFEKAKFTKVEKKTE